jgi:DNA polymerase-1
MGFATALKVGFQPYEILASLANEAIKQNMNIRIVSHDKDLYQLIDDDIIMFDPIKKQHITSDSCFEKYGVYPRQFTSYQALLGDSVDNIPGVKGIGKVSATKLIQEYDSLENIYKNIQNIKNPRWQKLLNQSKEMAFLSYKLVTLDKNAFDMLSIEELELPKENPILKIAKQLEDLDMNQIISKVHKNGTSYKTTIPDDYKHNSENQEIKESFKYTLLNDEKQLFDTLNSIKDDSLVAFDTETTGLDTKTASLVGFSFCFGKNEAFYVPMEHFYLGVLPQIDKNMAKKAIEILNTKRLIVHNFKYDYAIVKNNLGIKLTLYADTMIQAWLLNSSKPVGLDKLVEKYFHHKMIGFKDIVKKGETFATIDMQKACEYASEDAFFTYKLYDKFQEDFKNNPILSDIANKIEFPFIKVLDYMENCGIRVDIDKLQELKEKNQEKLKILIDKIYDLSGTNFNINSPKQLGDVLFEILKLPNGKKTKTGYSTNEAVLLKLKDKHPIIKDLLEYRMVSKLQSTYVLPLLKLGQNDDKNKIYTSFLQTGTATGRLSSKNPNLQNIPVRSKEGREIRGAFVAKKGYKLVGIDYSQIELRLLAHFSKEPILTDAFKNDEDIHYQTASLLFGEDEAKNMRHIAKTINFGLIYGMGARKLSQTLQISTQDAKKYINSYFEKLGIVTSYLKQIEDEALKNSKVETLIGRYRNFDFSNVNGIMKASYLREAVNTVFQGSASDLIKLSMIKIYDKYKNNENISMLLQIHDELIFQIKDEYVDSICVDLKNIMEGIYTLDVPLKVTIAIGNNWSELK